MDDDAADESSEARAARLRRRIDQIKAGPRPPAEAEEPESPRNFVHRRMRELDEPDRGKSAEPD
jgi:hypothetical protein